MRRNIAWGALTATLLLAACSKSETPAVPAAPAAPAPVAAATPEKIVISNWDGYMPKDVLEKFTAETGVVAELSVHATNEEIMGKVTASGGKGYDVLFVSSPFAEALEKMKLLAAIDHSKVPNLDNLYPEANQLAYDPGNKFSVPYTWGTTGLCYRSDKVNPAPTSWMDLLKPSAALKGKVTMLATERWLMGSAQKALGYSVNTTKPDELDRVKKLLLSAKGKLLAYDDTTFYDKLVSGEALLTHAWDGWCNYGIAKNPAIKFMVPKEGSDMWVDTLVIPSASEHQVAAHRFINYIQRPDVQQWVIENVMYKVANKTAMERTDPKLLQQYPNLAMKPADLLKFELLRDLGDAQKSYSRIATEISASK